MRAAFDAQTQQDEDKQVRTANIGLNCMYRKVPDGEPHANRALKQLAIEMEEKEQTRAYELRTTLVS